MNQRDLAKNIEKLDEVSRYLTELIKMPDFEYEGVKWGRLESARSDLSDVLSGIDQAIHVHKLGDSKEGDC